MGNIRIEAVHKSRARDWVIVTLVCDNIAYHTPTFAWVAEPYRAWVHTGADLIGVSAAAFGIVATAFALWNWMHMP